MRHQSPRRVRQQPDPAWRLTGLHGGKSKGWAETANGLHQGVGWEWETGPGYPKSEDERKRGEGRNGGAVRDCGQQQGDGAGEERRGQDELIICYLLPFQYAYEDCKCFHAKNNILRNILKIKLHHSLIFLSNFMEIHLIFNNYWTSWWWLYFINKLNIYKAW